MLPVPEAGAVEGVGGATPGAAIDGCGPGLATRRATTAIAASTAPGASTATSEAPRIRWDQARASVIGRPMVARGGWLLADAAGACNVPPAHGPSLQRGYDRRGAPLR